MSSINWRAWSAEAFADASAADKPVLLSITAPWCLFCQSMDEQTYANDAISQYINDNLIPVRVDSDKRPDINTRYSQGGWPSTCILTNEGDLIWGGTFVPADGFAQLLPQLLNEYRNNKPGLANHVAQQREQIRQQNSPPPLDTTQELSLEVSNFANLNVKHFFDFAFGGFKLNTQKFPQIEALELALAHYNRSSLYGYPDNDMRFVFERSLEAMAEGGLQDPIDGGFFRYTQNVDWGAPQPEKILKDNAQIARVYTHAYQVTGNEDHLAVADRTFAFLDSKLYDKLSGTWAGSQLADATYYSREDRSVGGPPAVDHTVYTGANASAVRALVSYWRATGSEEHLAKAKKAMDSLRSNVLSKEGVLIHFFPNKGDSPKGILSDINEMTAANVDLYEAGQGTPYLDAAQSLADYALANLEDGIGGGLFDHLVLPGAVGNLQVGSKDVGDNVLMADTLLRLFLLTGEEKYAQCAQRVLQAFQPAIQNLGFFAAALALATERALLPPVVVHVLGNPSDPAFKALLHAAQKPYRHDRIVLPLNPDDEEDASYIEELGYAKPTVAIAYPHLSTTPLPPTSDPETLSETIAQAGKPAPEEAIEEVTTEA
jgi:uncharacterized protein